MGFVLLCGYIDCDMLVTVKDQPCFFLLTEQFW
jgi:hypothetical protein